MKLNSITKVNEGKFISRYDISYTTEEGNEKNYEIVSRNKDLKTQKDLINDHVDGVVIIMTDESDQKILLNHEFRMSVGDWVYNFPAGLVDPGEDAKTAAVRELKEETGLDVVRIDDELFDSYSAIGFSNETNRVVIGSAKGQIRASDSDLEEINAGWYSKDQIKDLLKTEHFAARTQAYCYLWSK